MKIHPTQHYGNLKKNVGYDYIAEGRDYYLLKNGYYIPKNLTKTSIQIAEEEDFFKRDRFEDDYEET